MRTPLRRNSVQAQTLAPIIDASGHIFDADIYQDRDGTPRISTRGNFYLHTGKKHK
tara:strand:- start:503 stop:670 length:168 start_codon:yes stop_codon:yes gene_type:complete